MLCQKLVAAVAVQLRFETAAELVLAEPREPRISSKSTFWKCKNRENSPLVVFVVQTFRTIDGDVQHLLRSKELKRKYRIEKVT